jgi:hypothetical protein
MARDGRAFGRGSARDRLGSPSDRFVQPRPCPCPWVESLARPANLLYGLTREKVAELGMDSAAQLTDVGGGVEVDHGILEIVIG